MIKKILLAAVALVTLGTAIPAYAQQGDRRERDSRYEQREDREQALRRRPDRDRTWHHPGRCNNHKRYDQDRYYRGRYYSDGYYYHHRYWHHGRWRYR